MEMEFHTKVFYCVSSESFIKRSAVTLSRVAVVAAAPSAQSNHFTPYLQLNPTSN